MGGTITRENEQFILRAITKGIYRDRNEAINAGLELLKQRGQLLDRIDEGRRQLDSGEYVEYDGQQLRERFASLKEKTNQKHSQNQDAH